MTVSDLARTRFAYSPLAEVGESLYALAGGSVYGLHRGWHESVAPRLGSVDMELLRAVVPPRPWIAGFLFAGVVDATTSIEAQLELLSGLPHDVFAAELQSVWQGGPPPARASDLLDPGGPRRLADVLFHYWTAAIEPHWPAMRAVLDEDVAYRAGDLARGGAAAMLAGMHPELSIRGDMLSIAKKRAGLEQETQLAGDGLLLVPSVFVWPNVVFADVLSYRYHSAQLFNIKGDPSLQPVLDGCITGSYQPAIVDGFFMMVKPLSPGFHTIIVHGTNTHGDDRTYNYRLTVAG